MVESIVEDKKIDNVDLDDHSEEFQDEQLSAPKQSGGRKRSKSRRRTSGKGKAIGSRAEVWHGTADHTSGGLKKGDLMKNKRGLIVSRAKHAIGQKMFKKNPELREMAKKMKKKWSKRKSARKSSHSKSKKHPKRRSTARRLSKNKRRPSGPLFF